MKRFLQSLVVLLAIMLTLPYLTGWIVKLRYKQWEELTVDLASVQVRTVKYDRGWLSTVAETFIEIKDPRILKSYRQYAKDHQQPVYPIGFLLRHKIYHGPIVFDEVNTDANQGMQFAQALAYTQVLFAKDNNHTIEPFFSGKDFSRARTWIRYNGAGESIIESVGFHLNDNDEEFTWRGFRGNFEFTGGFHELSGQLMLPGFQYKSANAEMEVNDIKFETERVHSPVGLWLGDLNFQSKLIYIRDRDVKNAFSVRDLQLQASTTSKDELLTSQSKVSVESVRLGGHEYGPGTIEGALRNVDEEAVAAVYQLWHDAKLEKINNQNVRLADEFLRVLPDIFVDRPVLDISINQFGSEDGEINGMLHMELGGRDFENASHPLLSLLQTLEANLSLSLPKMIVRNILEERMKDKVALETHDNHLTATQFIEEVKKQLSLEMQDLERRKILIPTDHEYTFNATFKDQKFILNDEEVNLPL